MIILFFIVGLILGGTSIVFALQNTSPATINFFDWQVTGSTSIVLIMAILSGAVIVILLLLPTYISNSFKFRRLKKENSRLEEELRKQKEKTVFAKNTPPSAEDIKKIEDEAIEMP